LRAVQTSITPMNTPAEPSPGIDSIDGIDVYFLVLPDVHLLDLSGPAQAIHESNELHGQRFNLHFVSPDSTVKSWEGLGLSTLSPLPSRVAAGSLIFVCGTKLSDAFFNSAATIAAVGWLRQAHAQGSRAIGVCTGAFILGRAGLLERRHCTTHHRYLRQLREEFPTAKVMPERIFVEDGGIYTSAGVTAGIDLTLHLLGNLVGERQAVETARDLVVYIRRMADDPQISDHFRFRNHISPLVHEVQDYIGQHSLERITVDSIANHFNVSARHLQRLFKANVGISVKENLTRLRLAHAESLIRETGFSIEWVAEKSGFQSIQSFRGAWLKQFRVTPTQARKAFRTGSAEETLIRSNP
jgi:transcriptional regulator GlxA family with amidase domain